MAIRVGVLVITILGFASIVLGGKPHNSTNPGSAELTFPVLMQCKSYALESLSSLAEFSDISYEYEQLSYIPASHSDFTGVLTVRSQSLSRPDLLKTIAEFMMYCNPTSSTTIVVSDKNFMDVLEHVASIRGRGARGKIYLDLDDDTLVFRYQDLDIPKKKK